MEWVVCMLKRVNDDIEPHWVVIFRDDSYIAAVTFYDNERQQNPHAKLKVERRFKQD